MLSFKGGDIFALHAFILISGTPESTAQLLAFRLTQLLSYFCCVQQGVRATALTLSYYSVNVHDLSCETVEEL